MKKSYLPLLIILIGMILTQLFFTLLVYRSNLNLFQATRQIIGAGYLPVPNEHILPSLQKLSTAYKGALFFTLTLGIVMPVLVYGLAWAWDRGYKRNRIFLIILSGFVIFCMVMANWQGFNPIVTFWFLITYFTVFKLTLRSLDNMTTQLSTKRLSVHIIVLALLGAAWMTVPAGVDFFKSIRDYVLLSNKPGEAITQFYYRYSPYPTEACKPLFNKQLKTCRIVSGPDDENLKRIRHALIHYDFLPIDTDFMPDVVIRVSGESIGFETKGRTVLSVETEVFLKTPGEYLYRLSSRCDRQKFTRRFLAVSIKYGLPIVIYICMFVLTDTAVGWFVNHRKRFPISAASCVAIGAGVLIAFHLFAPESVRSSQLKNALQSGDPGLRVAALRTISARELDPRDYVGETYNKHLPYIPERLWWVKSLRNSKHPDVYEALLRFLDDPQPIVSCMAYDALREKGYRKAVLPILKRINTSRHWYVQGYAYQALRSLGWKQNRAG